MADARPERADSDGKGAEHSKAADAYAAAARSLSRLVERSAVAVDAWSTLARTADAGVRKAAAAASESSAERKGAAENLLNRCCLDDAGRVDIVPGTWTGEIAAGAEGMASLSSRAAGRWSARGALLTAPTELPVLAEMSVSEAWLRFAADVGAAELAAAGTALGPRPVDELAAAAARRSERLARARVPLSFGADGAGGGYGGELADVVAATAGRRAAADVRDHAAREAAESKAILRGAVDMWTEASAEWSRARDLAVGEGNKEVASMAAEQARSAGEHAARLRAA